MTGRRVLAFFVLMVIGVAAVSAADVNGKWTSEFDSQIGVQKYVFELLCGGPHNE